MASLAGSDTMREPYEVSPNFVNSYGGYFEYMHAWACSGGEL